MSRPFAREKIKPVLIRLVAPISNNLEGVLAAKPIVALKNAVFKPSRMIQMRLDGFENLEDLPNLENYSVRTYRQGDEEIWVRLVKRSFGGYYHADIAEICEDKEFNPNGFFFLTFHNQTVGTIYAKQLRDRSSKIGCIHMLCVVPEHRGKHLGHYLVLYALYYFKKIGIKSVVLIVDEFNEIAIKTYLSTGFKPNLVHGQSD
jgi:ribosomal protein S18 acetylase RimI-like enzyme